MNDSDFELRELRLFLAVAEAGSFTEAAAVLAMSQSALTRQIQSLESKLGRQLFSRTTRTIRLTLEGEFWKTRARLLLGQADAAREAFAEEFVDRPPTVRVAVCPTIGLAYLPGFFHGFRRNHPQCQIRLTRGDETELISDLDHCTLDIAIVTRPASLPSGIEITHSFDDAFVLIGPIGEKEKVDLEKMDSLPTIRIASQTATGKLVSAWQREQKVNAEPMMEFDDFDLIINSVALGLGFALVPRRALAIYSKNRKFRRYTLTELLTRTLCALARAETNRPRMIQAFIDSILF